MSAAKLEKPDIIYKNSCLEALQELHEEGLYTYVNLNEIKKDFEGFIKKVNNGKKDLLKPYPDWAEPVLETALWLVKEHEVIGSLNIRHRLNWHLEKSGGHVHFIIRPSMRSKGFGKKILQKAIPYIAHHGVENALLTVDPKNAPANRIVQFCGGKLQDTLPETDKFPSRNRYWLDCT